MAFTVSIAGAASIKIGESANYTATATGAAVEGTVTYVWTIDGASNPEATNVLRYTGAAPAGKKVLKVVATSTPTEGEPEVAEKTFEVTVANKTIGALSLTLDPTSVSKEIGQSQVVTANVSGVPAGATMAYVWKRNTTVISGQTGKTITVTEAAEANYTLNCEVTVTAPEYDPATATKGIAVTFVKKTISGASVTLTPASISTEKGSSAQFKADVVGAPSGVNATYSWKKNGSIIPGESSNTLAVDTSTVGSYTIEVSVVLKGTDYNDLTVTKTGSVTITKKTMTGVSVTLAPASINTPEGTPASFKATVAGAPAGATFAYSWKKDGSPVAGTTDTLVVDTSAEGSQVIEVSVVVSATDYNPVTVKKSGNVTITPKVAPEPEGELPYVHPLPVRNSAYIWAGWWVMDEIQKMTLEGKDWKTDDPDSNYYLHRYTLQKMVADYPEVDVQESRNGRIIHRSALDTGIIYFY
ncbi:hoc head outer capsid protein [Escherichia phage JS10]|uniref:Highly immunogenic outer capsid protein n=1 Tax=Escherichia phage JS10 TaxID=576790 RepID=C4MZS3_9CAUD|nr:Hoc-like head decoration [Escherichia phage JS10]ACL78404.1 hoc head outer capsid protein [Escherichia phage JS10]